MNRINRMLLAAVVAGISVGVGLVHASSLNSAVAVQRLDDLKNPHMHNALAHLRYSHDEISAAGGAFKAHAPEVLAFIDAATKEIEAGLEDQSDSTSTAADPPVADRDSEAKFSHLHHALDRLVEARVELETAETIFAGHRDKALDSTDNAIRMVEDSLHDVEK